MELRWEDRGTEGVGVFFFFECLGGPRDLRGVVRWQRQMCLRDRLLLVSEALRLGAAAGISAASAPAAAVAPDAAEAAAA